MLHSQNLIHSQFSFPTSHLFNLPSSISPSLGFLCKPVRSNRRSVLANVRTRVESSWLSQVEETEPSSSTTTAVPEEEGPIELPSSTPSIFANSDNPSNLQVATSFLLTGAITVLLFRSFRRRAKRAREKRLAAEAEKKTLKDAALETLKAMTPVSSNSKAPPSPVQALLGSVTAGVIALILYKFATTIEATLSRQTLSDNYSVRQLTITIRTIVNGLCYLATFVFGFNSLGLFLYSGQLTFNSLMGTSTSEESVSKTEVQADTSNSEEKCLTNNSENNSSSKDQTSDSNQ